MNSNNGAIDKIICSTFNGVTACVASEGAVQDLLQVLSETQTQKLLHQSQLDSDEALRLARLQASQQ